MSYSKLAAAYMASAAVCLFAADTAPASASDCNKRIVLRSPRALVSLTTVLSVRNMSCGQARRIVADNASNALGSQSLYRKGGRFGLGPFRCRVYFALYEDWRARCVSRSRAFRIDYGA